MVHHRLDSVNQNGNPVVFLTFTKTSEESASILTWESDLDMFYIHHSFKSKNNIGATVMFLQPTIRAL